MQDPPLTINQDINEIEYECEEYAHNEQIINDISNLEEVGEIKIEVPENDNNIPNIEEDYISNYENERNDKEYGHYSFERYIRIESKTRGACSN